MSSLDFAALKKKSGAVSISEVRAQMDKKNSSYTKDERFWEPTQDKTTGLGSAVIRFLPNGPTSDKFWMDVGVHAFKENGKWLFVNCPKDIGGKCPICDDIAPLWNSTNENEKKLASRRGRKVNFIANILVINDPAAPENNGKVKLYKYGRAIQNLIDLKLTPKYDDEDSVNVFDFWAGANFHIRIKNNKGGFRDYSDSKFDFPSVIGSDSDMEVIWRAQYVLEEFKKPELYKSYDVILNEYNTLLGTPSVNRILNEVNNSQHERVVSHQVVQSTPAQQSAPQPNRPETPQPSASTNNGAVSDDDWESMLDSLNE